MNREELIMSKVTDHYNTAVSLGFEVVAVFLQGSQNYELDEYSEEYMSDVDTKCIILPKLSDFVNGNEPYSSTHILPNDEHIDIKDIRVMFEMFKKQNNSFIEILFTKYFIINPKYEELVQKLLLNREKIARMNFNLALKAMAGTSHQKLIALEHHYPSVEHKIEKFGYDPKQLHHILRVNDLMKKFINKENLYADILVPNHAPFLLKIKKGILPLSEARRLALETDQDTKRLKEENLDPSGIFDPDAAVFLDELKSIFIKRFLKEEVLKDEE